MNDREKGFTQGVVWAVALLAKTGLMDADQIWTESGLNIKDLAVCDPCDAEIVRAVVNGD